MSLMERVTVTLPRELLEEVDRREGNRSRFVADAIRRELTERRREELRESLRNPHPETGEFRDEGMAEWTASLPDEDAEALLDPRAGKPVQWSPGNGWKRRRR